MDLRMIYHKTNNSMVSIQYECVYEFWDHIFLCKLYLLEEETGTMITSIEFEFIQYEILFWWNTHHNKSMYAND